MLPQPEGGWRGEAQLSGDFLLAQAPAGGDGDIAAPDLIDVFPHGETGLFLEYAHEVVRRITGEFLQFKSCKVASVIHNDVLTDRRDDLMRRLDRRNVKLPQGKIVENDAQDAALK